jgi:hypothetical protein
LDEGSDEMKWRYYNCGLKKGIITIISYPNPDKLSRSQRSGDPACGVVAKRKSRFVGELKIED